MVEEDGISEWAPGPEHPDQRQRAEEWAAEQEEDEQPAPEVNLDIIIHNLQDGLTPNYGDKIDLELRRKLLSEVEQLAKALGPKAPHGGIGHNNPPPDESSPEAAFMAEIRGAVETVRAEIGNPKLDALEVAKATSRLKSVLNWIGKKADTWVDGFVKESGSAAGKWLTTVAGTYIGIQLFPGVGLLISNVVNTASQWLHHITMLF